MTEPIPLKRVFTMTDLEACARRELGWRRKVYPNRIHDGRMSAQKAHLEIAMMQAIAEHYAELAKSERLL